MHGILKSLRIIQVASNEGREKKLGRGFSSAYRLNPFNPLTYIFLIGLFVVGITVFGVVGFWSQIDIKNPFKWD